MALHRNLKNREFYKAIDVWMDRLMDGCKSCFKDCLKEQKISDFYLDTGST